MKLTTTYEKTQAAFVDPKIRYIINQGGSSSSKTYSVMQLLYLFAIRSKKNDLISIVSENLPHLKRGCIRDIKNILSKDGLWNDNNFNKSESILKIDNKEIEFFGADSSSKLHGGRRDYLFINEANNVSKESFDQLSIRTRKKIILDYNPTAEFWAHTDLIGRDDVAFIKTTYKDNSQLEQVIIDDIERRKYNQDGTISDWYKVYGMGELGTLEGAVYQNWKQCNDFPWESNKLTGFIDFGFTNDPASVGVAGIYNSEIYTKEFIYERGLTNQMLAQRIKDLKIDHLTFIADSAEPKSIAELQMLGISVIPAKKPKGSINYGIDLLKGFTINVTKDSLNAVKELRQYQWRKDKMSGKWLNEPIDDWNHYLDGLRYWALIKLDRGNTFTNKSAGFY